MFDWNLFWTAVSAIGQVAAIPALLFTAWSFYRGAQIQHYDDIDSMYQALLSHLIDKPYLADPVLCTSDDKKLQYNVYAFMVWNFVETVFDRTNGDHFLFQTWIPAIKHEKVKHGGWLQIEENKVRFKKSFLDRISIDFAACD